MIKREEKEKRQIYTKIVKAGFFCNAAVLGDNTDVPVILKGFFSIQNVSKHFFSIYLR